MDTVYVLRGDDEDSQHPLGVYATKEEALEAQAKVAAMQTRWYVSTAIDEFEMGEMPR